MILNQINGSSDSKVGSNTIACLGYAVENIEVNSFVDISQRNLDDGNYNYSINFNSPQRQEIKKNCWLSSSLPYFSIITYNPDTNTQSDVTITGATKYWRSGDFFCDKKYYVAPIYYYGLSSTTKVGIGIINLEQGTLTSQLLYSASSAQNPYLVKTGDNDCLIGDSVCYKVTINEDGNYTAVVSSFETYTALNMDNSMAITNNRYLKLAFENPSGKYISTLSVGIYGQLPSTEKILGTETITASVTVPYPWICIRYSLQSNGDILISNSTNCLYCLKEDNTFLLERTFAEGTYVTLLNDNFLYIWVSSTEIYFYDILNDQKYRVVKGPNVLNNPILFNLDKATFLGQNPNVVSRYRSLMQYQISLGSTGFSTKNIQAETKGIVYYPQEYFN